MMKLSICHLGFFAAAVLHNAVIIIVMLSLNNPKSPEQKKLQEHFQDKGKSIGSLPSTFDTIHPMDSHDIWHIYM